MSSELSLIFGLISSVQSDVNREKVLFVDRSLLPDCFDGRHLDMQTSSQSSSLDWQIDSEVIVTVETWQLLSMRDASRKVNWQCRT